jgi:phosphoglycolate phosphatase-like HAD superfamily hydrolase/ADP-ribose pyrophosphatase YjhB (NUDIX family)
MRSYDLYIFDLDDTLLTTFRTVAHRHYPKLAEMLGLEPPPIDTVRKNWHKPLGDSLQSIFGDSIDTRSAIQMLSRLHNTWPIDVQPGVTRILRTLDEHGKGIGVFSSCVQDILRTSIQAGASFGLDLIDVLYSTVEHDTPKPSAAILHRMVAEYEHLYHRTVVPEQVIVLGDSLADLQTAQSAGVDFGAVTSGVTEHEDFVAAGLNPDHIFPSVREAVVPPASHGIVAIIRNHREEVLLVREARKNNPYFGYWSGPHGRCRPEDVIEEETVVREVCEECGVQVKPTKKVYTRPADTKVKTVSFWLAELSGDNSTPRPANHETDEIAWVSLDAITARQIPLYPGTEDFFHRYF